MTVQPTTAILMAIVLVETVIVMFGWNWITRGAWTDFPAGRVLMALLGVQSAILLLATLSGFFPAFPGRPYIYLGLYSILIFVVGWLGYTIIREQRKHRDQQKHNKD